MNNQNETKTFTLKIGIVKSNLLKDQLENLQGSQFSFSNMNILKSLSDFAKFRDQTKGITQPMKMFYQEMLSGIPIMYTICRVSKYPLDLKDSINALCMFSRKISRDESSDNRKIKEIIDEQDGLTKENFLLNFTQINQEERINAIKAELNSEKTDYENLDELVKNRIEGVETKGKKLMELQSTYKQLKGNSKSIKEKKQKKLAEFESREMKIKEFAKDQENEREELNAQLFNYSNHNHKLNEEFQYLNKKLKDYQVALLERLKVEESVKDTNSLMNKTASAQKSYYLQEQNKKTEEKNKSLKKKTDDNYSKVKKSSVKLFNKLSDASTITPDKTNIISSLGTLNEVTILSPVSDLSVNDIENNYQMLEKDKIISKLKNHKNKLSKEIQFKDEKINEIGVQLNYFKRMEKEAGVEVALDGDYDYLSELVQSENMSINSRVSYKSGSYQFNEKAIELNNFSLNRRKSFDENLSAIGDEFEWGCKRLKIDHPLEKEDLKRELKYLNNRSKMLEECLNIKRIHEDYYYKKNNDLNLKKMDIEDDVFLPALDFLSEIG